MSFLSSLFGGQGSGYASTQLGQQTGVGADAYNILQSLQPEIQAETQQAINNEPLRQQQIGSLIQNLSPGNQAAENAAYANQVNANARTANSQSMAQEAAAGLSPAYQAGGTTAENNNAAEQINQHLAYTLSPEYQLQQGNARLGLIGQSMQDPFANEYSQMAGLVYGQPHITPQPGILSSLAGPIGDYLTGGVLGGGGGGGGGYTNNYTPGVSGFSPGASDYGVANSFG